MLYTGKGGVGKTTTAAAAALCGAERGRRTLLASADAAHSLGDVLERRLGAEPVEVAPRLDAMEIDARVETARHWGAVQEYLVSLFLYQGIESVVAEELALLPGAEELTTLVAVEERARESAYDLVVLDCAPTDATLRLATLPEVATGMLRVALPLMRALAGATVPLAQRLIAAPLPEPEIFREAQSLLYDKLLALRRRISSPETSVRFVVTPERMVIDEARRAYTELSLFEVGCDAVVMNRMLPREAADEDFFHEWFALQEERLREVERLFAGIPVLTAPLRDDELTGVERLAEHGRELFRDSAPEAQLRPIEPMRFLRDADGVVARLPLPGADAASLEVVKVDDELVVTAGGRRRAVKLPRTVVPLSLSDAKLEEACLLVRFASVPASESATGAA